MDLSALRRASRARLLSLSRRSRDTRWRRASLGLGALVLMAGVSVGCTPPPPQTRIDLKVLVFNDGASNVVAIRDELRREGVPFQEVSLADPQRPVIDAAFLSSSTTSPPVEEAKFQAVVSTNQTVTQFCQTAPCPGLNATELAALRTFEIKFGIRHVIAQTSANPDVGLNWAVAPGYYGGVDGLTATVTPAGRSGAFNYLAGPVPFDPKVGSAPTPNSSAYLSTPLATLPTGATFTSLVTMPAPGTGTVGTIIGAYQHDGREELVVTADMGGFQSQFQAFARGFVNWMTKGIHLGHNRNYLTVHVDDLYASDARWNSALNCTPTEDCPAGTPNGTDIRMTEADVIATVNWQQVTKFKFDWAYNGFGSDDWVTEHGSDPLLAATTANAAQFGWLNHTYTHEFLGCQQDFTVIPWRCKTDASGQTLYVPQATITDEINRNKTFATAHNLPIDPAELVTGEHSGMFVLPQQPNDNPNLAPALAATGITSLAADNSRQPESRLIGPARTVPRYPMANFYNVGTRAEMADEYNWIFTTVAQGGSGKCVVGTSEAGCIDAPVNPTTGYESTIVPKDAKVTITHMTSNDPRPHYAHQSNLSEDRILLTLMTSVLDRYSSTFNTTLVPPKHVTQTQAANILANQAAWSSAAANSVSAYTQNGVLHVNKGTYTGAVPITTPTGAHVGTATGAVFGESYAGEQSDWKTFTGEYQVVLAAAPGA